MKLTAEETLAAACCVVAWLAWNAGAADWPQWRHDAARSAVTDEELPPSLRLQWVRSLPSPKPAWRDSQPLLRFDASYEPIAAGDSLFVPSMTADRLTAYDAATGNEKWRFYANGPVRFAPAYCAGMLFFVSDDGFLYCLDAKTGLCLWTLRGGPEDRMGLGNDRVCSLWQCRGGPVIDNGVVYFAAGIWPFMGVFIHAVDIQTGRVKWSNSSSGMRWTVQPHLSPAFGGIAPQGYLAVGNNRLLVPGGRTSPAGFDADNGALKFFMHGENPLGQFGGGWQVTILGDVFLNRQALHRMSDGQGLHGTSPGIGTSDALFGINKGILIAKRVVREQAGGPDTPAGGNGFVVTFPWKAEIQPAPDRLHLRAGNRLYASTDKGLVMAIELAPGGGASVSWEARVHGTPWTMLAANGRLFVVTLEGSVYCFGDRRAGGHMLTESRPAGTASSPPGVAVEAEAMIGASGATNGFAAVLGLEDGALLAELARRSAMRVVGVDSDPAVVARLRRRFDDEGLYGERVHLVHGDPFKVSLPPYFADLVVSEKTPRLAAGDAATALFRILRPYGGVICLRSGSRESSDLAAAIAAAFPGEAVVREKKSLLLVSRPGGLPGAGSWTHENADAAGTVNSGDRLVKPPLGILWFGGPSNDRVLPRHGHGPAPEVIGGRLLIEGCDMIRAVDVYTGRLLWEREIKDIGLFFETIHHRPGATEIGGNFAAAEDGVYVMQPDSCLWLDAHSGATRASFKPPKTGVSARTKWGSIRVLDGLLVATADPVNIPIEGVNRPFPWVRPSATPRTDSRRRPAKGIESVEGVDAAADHATGSRMLVVLDRHTGRILWSMRSEQVFRHNAIAAGNGRIFVMDRFSGAQADYLRKRGYEPGEGEGLHALDARTGRVLWTARNGLFGTWLSYSAEHDVLLEATSQHRDCAPDETGEGMRVYAAGDGGILWEKKSRLYDGPCILVGDRIIAKGKAYSLPTGEQIMRPHPLTGEKVPWNFQKAYGCSTAVGSELMLTFRSAAAGFFDLAGAWGTGNLGGFRSGCTPNLIPADGVLNAPDYTRTCTCAYQNQTSLALIHMPGVEVWTFGDVPGYGASSSRIIHAGVNFGAPGDRMADDGTLWLACPNPGFPSPRMKIEVAGSPVYFSRHSSTVAGALPWVSGSWLEGDSIITLGLRLLPTPSDTDIQAGPEAPMPSPSGETLDEKRYTVRLYFSEPSSGRPGERVFDVALQNDTVLTGYDIAKDAGGPARGVYREFSGVLAGDELKIGLKGRVGKPLLCGVSLRVEE